MSNVKYKISSELKSGFQFETEGHVQAIPDLLKTLSLCWILDAIHNTRITLLDSSADLCLDTTILNKELSTRILGVSPALTVP